MILNIALIILVIVVYLYTQFIIRKKNEDIKYLRLSNDRYAVMYDEAMLIGGPADGINVIIPRLQDNVLKVPKANIPVVEWGDDAIVSSGNHAKIALYRRKEVKYEYEGDDHE